VNHFVPNISAYGSHLIFWLPAVTCYLYFPKVWQIRAIFSQNSFACVEIIFQVAKKCKNSPKRTNDQVVYNYEFLATWGKLENS
jgi:hypothetical protein